MPAETRPAASWSSCESESLLTHRAVRALGTVLPWGHWGAPGPWPLVSADARAIQRGRCHQQEPPRTTCAMRATPLPDRGESEYPPLQPRHLPRRASSPCRRTDPAADVTMKISEAVA